MVYSLLADKIAVLSTSIPIYSYPFPLIFFTESNNAHSPQAGSNTFMLSNLLSSISEHSNSAAKSANLSGV